MAAEVLRRTGVDKVLGNNVKAKASADSGDATDTQDKVTPAPASRDMTDEDEKKRLKISKSLAASPKSGRASEMLMED